MIEEKVFYLENRNLLDNEEIKRIGYKFEAANTLGINKNGWYVIIKADDSWFERNKEIMKGMEEVKGEEKEKVLNEFKKLEENVISGIGSLF